MSLGQTLSIFVKIGWIEQEDFFPIQMKNELHFKNRSEIPQNLELCSSDLVVGLATLAETNGK